MSGLHVAGCLLKSNCSRPQQANDRTRCKCSLASTSLGDNCSQSAPFTDNRYNYNLILLMHRPRSLFVDLETCVSCTWLYFLGHAGCRAGDAGCTPVKVCTLLCKLAFNRALTKLDHACYNFPASNLYMLHTRYTHINCVHT